MTEESQRPEGKSEKKSKIGKPEDRRNQRYAITLGEQSILHIGGKVTGKGLAEEGFTVSELFGLMKKFPTSEFTLLSAALPKEHRKGNSASILIIRGGINVIMGDEKYADK